jgi:hypothetical protein
MTMLEELIRAGLTVKAVKTELASSGKVGAIRNWYVVRHDGSRIALKELVHDVTGTITRDFSTNDVVPWFLDHNFKVKPKTKYPSHTKFGLTP